MLLIVEDALYGAEWASSDVDGDVSSLISVTRLPPAAGRLIALVDTPDTLHTIRYYTRPHAET